MTADRDESRSPPSGPSVDINEDFYETEPYLYLDQRLANLVAVYGKGPELDELLVEVNVGLIKYARSATDQASAHEDHRRFATLEALVLLHHVSETLLRLYLAHRDLPPYPWRELTGEVSFAAFKRKVSDLRPKLRRGDEVDHLNVVFHGVKDRSDFATNPSETQWKAASNNLSHLLNHFAGVFLDASVYNAVKHGLALTPGGLATDVEVDGRNIFSASGPSIQYLHRRNRHGNRTWELARKWVDIDRSIGLAHVGCNLIRALWINGEHRYTERTPSLLPRLWDRPALDDLVDDDPLAAKSLTMEIKFDQAA